MRRFVIEGHLGTAAVMLLVALMFFPDPQFPQSGLDPSWILANEHAAQAGLTFGRDYVFTYGPLALLSTHLYEPGSFVFVILGELYLSVVFVLPLFVARGAAPKLFYMVTACMAPFGPDARVGVTSFALLVVTLERRNALTVLLAALIAPFVLAKFSYALIVLPVLALADIKHLGADRRAPIFLPIALVTILLSYQAIGQPLSGIPALFRNVGDVVTGYGGAMQVDGRLLPLIAVLLVIAALLALGVWLLHERWKDADHPRRWTLVVLLAGMIWTLFTVFKMGHVRQDRPHIVITWQALIALVPVVVAGFASAAPLKRRALFAAGALMAVASASTIFLTDSKHVAASGGSGVAAQHRIPLQLAENLLVQRVESLVSRPVDALRWATPGRWTAMTARRQAAEASLARPFQSMVLGSVDAIPYDVAPLIASRLNYHPRPVPQSYSAYTPRLQQLDAGFLADPRTGPDTLLFKLGDIDGRLPTLATGPTLPVLLRWYRPAGDDALGLILRRRAAPSAATLREAGHSSFRLFDPIAVPAASDSVTLSYIILRKTIVGRLLGFLFREPTLEVEVSFVGAPARTYRFVPGMAEAGFLISPLPLNSDAAGLSDPAPLFTNDGTELAKVSDIRIFGGGAARLAFDGGEIRFEMMSVVP